MVDDGNDDDALRLRLLENSEVYQELQLSHGMNQTEKNAL